MNLTFFIALESFLMASIFAGGFFLARGGMPYNQLLFNLHKLLVLGNIVFLNYWTVFILKGADNRGSLTAVLVITNCLFLVAMISGGIQNLENLPARDFVHILHKITPWLTIVSTGGLIVLLSRFFAQ